MTSNGTGDRYESGPGDLCEEGYVIRIHQSLETVDFESVDSSGLTADFLRGWLSVPSNRLVANVETSTFLLQVGKYLFPATRNDKEYENSYVCSPYNAMVSYSLEELGNIDSRLIRAGIRSLVGVMSPLLKVCRINRVVCINNLMLSTNLYPDWKGEELDVLTEELVRRYPRHVIMFRSLNFATTPDLCAAIGESGYELIPSRVLYVLDPADRSVLRKQNNQIDGQLLARTPYTVVGPGDFSEEDDEQVRSLYNQLYLEKYSYHNPHFNSDLIRLFRTTRQMQFMGLRDLEGALVGVIGTLAMNGQFTTPIVGYDFSIPVRAGLYRLLTRLVINKAFEESKLFNMSSGVGRFKKHRGAKPHVEYSAIYIKHLPWRQRQIWKKMGWLMKNVAAPLVQKYEL